MAAEAALSSNRHLLLDLLIVEGKVDEKNLDPLYQLQAKEGVTIEQGLVSLRMVTDQEIAEAYARCLHVDLIELDEEDDLPPPETIELLPEKFIRDSRVIPLREEGGSLHVAVVDPSDLGVLHQIQLHSGLTPVIHVAPLVHVERVLNQIFGTRDLVSEIALEVPTEEDGLDADLEDEILDLDRPILDTQDTQVIRMVNHILRQAIEQGTSDIHIEPRADDMAVRYRIDGVLQSRPSPPKSMFLPLLSRLKVISKMDIAEKRLPQDGGCSVRFKGSQIDVRVSTVPTIYGQKMVLRILNKDALPLDLEALGFDAVQRASFAAAAKSPHGLIFVTGPTGSGKSTTLYATLSLLNEPGKNLVTVEDPVEYKLSGINQVQTQAHIGLTFASTLRSFLRQDPDVIMVGEVRDQETAEICLRAALTGHMVVSTLHTNSALGAVERLVDMGIEPFMLATTMRLVEAQRLVRRLCKECKEPELPDAETAEKYNLDPNKEIYRPRGCEACNNVGYKGRVGIFEVIQITPELAAGIQTRAPLPELYEAAVRGGMDTLLLNGLGKVREGLTSLEEIVKSTMEGEE